VKLADGVYAVLRHNAPADPSDANSTIIINEHDVVVVDANIVTSSSRRVIDEIRKLTDKPVRYVINTHAHSDHHYGNQAYRETWPGVDFIAHVATRDEILTTDIPSFQTNRDVEYPKAIASMRATLARGTTSKGAPLTEAQKASLGHSIVVHEWYLKESGTFRPLPPTLTFTDSLVLHRGERSIVVRHLGRANTRGDAVVHLPRERILATGDIVVSPIPFAFGSFLGDWTGVLKQLQQLPADIIVPGHGELQRDWSYVRLLDSVFTATLDRVRTASSSGAPLDSVRARVKLDDFRKPFTRDDPGQNAVFDMFVHTAVERAYEEVKK
jgi:glyoxylase-like metal-dependent hydrolase (beta-lactamase superfamily II)